MILAVTAGMALAIALTFWLARIPSSEPRANARGLLEARERREVLGGLADDAELGLAAAELDGVVLPAAYRPAAPPSAVPPKSAERST